MRFLTHSTVIFLLILSVFALNPENVFAAQTDRSSQQMLELQEQARSGDAEAQYLLGFMYDQGQGIPKDPQKALMWYTLAAEQGNADAQLTLGFMYDEGRGIERDQNIAVKWYTRAAEQGNAGAQVILALMLTENNETPDNLIQAYGWILQAESNHKDVADLKALLRGRLTPEQIAECEKQFSVRNRISGIDHPSRYILKWKGFSVLFPSLPRETVIRDDEHLLAVHYQSVTGENTVQYNASFQSFKSSRFVDELSRKTFLEDYLAGRAKFAPQNKIQKKQAIFRGFESVRFKHTVTSAGIETIHEGLAFIVDDNFVSLTCVYPSYISPDPSFNEFVSTFEMADKDPAEPDILSKEPSSFVR